MERERRERGMRRDEEGPGKARKLSHNLSANTSFCLTFSFSLKNEMGSARRKKKDKNKNSSREEVEGVCERGERECERGERE